MTSSNYSLANRTFPTVWDTLVVQTMPVETETCVQICQLEFRATKIAEGSFGRRTELAMLAGSHWGGVRWLTPFKLDSLW